MKPKLLLTIAAALTLTSCTDGSPTDTVIDNGKLTVYKVVARKDGALGKFEYWLRDNSTKGVKLITDQEFAEGDKLELRKLQQ